LLPGAERVEQARRDEVERYRRDRQPDAGARDPPRRQRLSAPLGARQLPLDVDAILDRALEPPGERLESALAHGGVAPTVTRRIESRPAAVARQLARARKPRSAVLYRALMRPRHVIGAAFACGALALAGCGSSSEGGGSSSPNASAAPASSPALE